MFNSIIIEGLDGSGKSSVGEILLQKGFICKNHKKNPHQKPEWWIPGEDLYNQMLFYIADNIQILNEFTSNFKMFSEKNLLSTIAIHSYFGGYDYKALLYKNIKPWMSEIKWLFIDCDSLIRARRILLREKKTYFDLETVKPKYIEHFKRVLDEFQKYIPLNRINNTYDKEKLRNEVLRIIE